MESNSICIVTGGAGFIGSHLTRRLVNEGHYVLVLDNLITTGNLKYINDLVNDGKLVFNNVGICNYPSVWGYVSEFISNLRYNGVTTMEGYIFNLASPASVKLYTRNPLLTYRTSTIGVENMLMICKNMHGMNWHFLETSTSEIYGDPLIHPQSESYLGNVDTQCERSCYDEGKRGAETLCYIYHKLYGIDTHIARIFNTYGPNNTDDRVMPTLIPQALKNEPLTIFGDGTQTRSFCYVDDTVEGLIRLMDSDYHEPMNIGNPHEVTINELAKIIGEVLGIESKIKYLPLPERDPKRRCPDITLAKTKLNWEPKVSLVDGIKSIIDWMSNAKI